MAITDIEVGLSDELRELRDNARKFADEVLRPAGAALDRLPDPEQVIARGFDASTVYRVVRMVDLNEYKRRQAATGPRVTRRGFGKDRRYPITNGWKPGI